MPVLFTFDLKDTEPNDRNRIQSMFERLGWQNLGGSSYRYPRLGSNQPVEDWFNHVIPALMLFRTRVVKRNTQLSRFTLDVQSSAGYDTKSEFGHEPVDGPDINLYETSQPAFGEKKLRDWLEGIDYVEGY